MTPKSLRRLDCYTPTHIISVVDAQNSWSAIKTQEDWERASELAEEDYYSGAFLIEQLGGHRFLDPSVVAVLQVLRQNLIEDHDIQSAAEFMLMDLALMAYYNTIKGQRMLGDLTTQIERELFRGDSLGVNLREKQGLIVNNFPANGVPSPSTNLQRLSLNR